MCSYNIVFYNLHAYYTQSFACNNYTVLKHTVENWNTHDF